MSQQTDITFRVSGDEPAARGTSPSLQEYLQDDDNIVDRLQRGTTDAGSLERIRRLTDQLDQLSGAVAGTTNGQAGSSQP